MPVTNCRHFNGYRPCVRSSLCDENCSHKDIPRISILIVHLAALGAVVRSTSLLMPIKRKFPSSRITWVTDRPAHTLLEGHPLIDRVLTTEMADLLQLTALQFDIAYVIDKSLKASGVLAMTHAEQIFGFVAAPATGVIHPATPAAEELWQLGLSNHQKFFVNQKPETQLLGEALELGPFQRDAYFLPLTAKEQVESQHRQSAWRAKPEEPIIGFNTGCSSVIPHKKWTVDFHRQVIQTFLSMGYRNLVLLGGPEDTERNERIAHDLPIVKSSTVSGLRDGLVSVDACDIVVTGDSLGLHMAVARKKFVVAWFGPTCRQEIDLYGRGIALQAMVPCAPCWKRFCDRSVMCYDQVPLKDVITAIQRGVQEWKSSTLSCKQPSLATSSSPSPS